MSEHLWNIWSNSLSQSFLPLTLVKFAGLPRTHRDTVKAVKGRTSHTVLIILPTPTVLRSKLPNMVKFHMSKTNPETARESTHSQILMPFGMGHRCFCFVFQSHCFKAMLQTAPLDVYADKTLELEQKLLFVLYKFM